MNKVEFPISEYFFSVQGEGYHNGKYAFFLRFGGCNLQCDFCDAKFTWTKYKMYHSADIFSLLKMARKKTNFLVLTGGEPTLYDLTGIVKFAKKLRFYVAVESNGIISPNWLKMVNWITISPKTVISAYNVKIANELKFVITGEESWNFMKSFMPFYPTFLMPVNNSKKIAKFILEKMEYNKIYKYARLGIQSHKVYKLK